MHQRLVAMLALLLFLLQVGPVWSAHYGPCPQNGMPGALASVTVQVHEPEGDCPHHQGQGPVSSAVGDLAPDSESGMASGHACGCDCCHMTATLPPMAQMLEPVTPQARLQVVAQSFLSHIPLPVVRPPIPAFPA